MRKDAIDIAISKMLNSTQKEILKNYKRALKDIRIEIAEIFEKYVEQEKLTYAQMARYNHLNNLNKQITATLEKATGKNAEEIVKLASETFNESYLMTAFKIEKELNVNLEFGLLDKKTIEASVQNPIDKLTLNKRLKKSRTAVISAIKGEITQGLIQGESYGKIANRIKSTLEQDTAKALRTARTETHRNQSNGRLESMQYAESKGVVMKKMWVATLDSNTRDTHQDMDGQIVGIDEDFVSSSGARGQSPANLGSAEEDINCRCSMITIIEGYEPTERRTGKEIIHYKNYKEWKQNLESGE